VNRAIGVARIKPVRLDGDELVARSTAWKYIQAARAAAHNGAFPPQARQDVEVLGGVLADLLSLHEPQGHSPLCPGCSQPDHPRLWPCPTWRRIVTRFLKAW